MTEFLTDAGKPWCFDAEDYFDASAGLQAVCDECPVRFQEQMLRERRCFPPIPANTAVGGLMADGIDRTQLRAILSQIRVGFLSDRLAEWPAYLGSSR